MRQHMVPLEGQAGLGWIIPACCPNMTLRSEESRAGPSVKWLMLARKRFENYGGEQDKQPIRMDMKCLPTWNHEELKFQESLNHTRFANIRQWIDFPPLNCHLKKSISFSFHQSSTLGTKRSKSFLWLN